MKNVYIYSLSFIFLANTALAQMCAAPPSCEAMGYTKTAADCSGIDKVLKCPSDSNKVFCVGITDTCDVGAILYSDKTCSRLPKADKTVIGIVFDKNKRLAVALSRVSKPWSPSGKIREDVTALTNCTADASTCTPNGKDNTAKIVAQYGNTTDYAAGYCANYATAGTKAGDWFLPSYAEQKLLMNNFVNINVTSVVIMGKSNIYGGYYIYTSTEIRENTHCSYNESPVNCTLLSKSNGCQVMPILAF